MLEVNFYDEEDDSLLKFSVIISKADGKWVFCKERLIESSPNVVTSLMKSV